MTDQQHPAPERAEDPTEESSDSGAETPKNSKGGAKKWILFGIKALFSIAMLVVIFRKVVLRDGSVDLGERIGQLSWGWIAAAVVMQLIAVAFATVRWRTLLEGQGIKPGWGFLSGSILIARFWGAFTPGGFTGFGGWRIYDVARHTGKTARATATIGTEMVLGQAAFGAVVMGASVFGFEMIGTSGVILVNLGFAAVIAGAIALMAKPWIFRKVASVLPGALQLRVQTLVDAICAYQGKTKLLLRAFAYGVGVHAFNNLIYVCAARALGVELSVGTVFFGSSLQILATLVPASINGIGLREAAAVALYTRVGVPPAVAVLIPIVGFCAEMFVSSFGGLIFMLRRSGYEPKIEVEEAEREEQALEAIPEVAEEAKPRPGRGLVIGLGAGLLAGVLVGIGEGLVVVLSGGGRIGLFVLLYGAIVYGLFCALGGGALGWGLAYAGSFKKNPLFAWMLRGSERLTVLFEAGQKILHREAVPEPRAYARITAFLVATMAFALGAFRIRRDVFHEELAWKSGQGLLVLVACLGVGAVLYLALSTLLRLFIEGRAGRFMLRSWGSPVAATGLIAALAIASFAVGPTVEAAPRGASERPAAPESAGPILFIVVDTMRADHLPSYGYEEGRTPNLDRFAAEDAIRFDQAFANASWTRPSFASILTGRYPSSHGVMAKSDSLPDELITLPEALGQGGYRTAGYVTNFNVGPYFNFGQGFDEYTFLEPEFVLGADDAAAKLLLVQFLRQRIENMRGSAEPGAAYQDAETVNRNLFSWLDRNAGDASSPFFLFAAYMDPHDPYFAHPYDGEGYARAGHQEPSPEDAPRLRALYDGEITYWDEHFGRLIAELRRRGLYDRMTIVVTADHGEEFHEHGGFWHGTTLYDEQVHVPLLIKLPESRRGGTVVRHWVQSIDLMPSLLREVGLEAPEGLQGGNLFEGTDRVFAEESHEGNVLRSLRERRGTDEIKIISANPNNPRGLSPIELYRVDNDPGERHDLATRQRDVVEQQMQQLVAASEHAGEGAVERRRVDLDAESAERLRAIGYMTGGDEEGEEGSERPPSPPN